MSGATPHGSQAPCALPGSPLDAARAGLDACVHCGFCLPACPTYLALEDENASPRGRLVLMRALLEGRLSPDDPDVHAHLDRCLGCRGCETACPSGVPYGELLEATRETVRSSQRLPWTARFLLWVFAREWALRPALAAARIVRALRIPTLLARLLPSHAAAATAMLASTTRARSRAWTPRADASRASVSLLTGCVMEGLLAPLNRATERTLSHNGYAVRATPGQGCCGALHAHAGDVQSARAMARRNIAAFEASGAEAIVMNSAGCGAMCRGYGHLLEDDPTWADRATAFSDRVRDVTELLAAAGPRPTAASKSGATRVAWDAPCHLQHAQRIVDPPLQVLRAIGDVELVPLEGSDQCCGSAGIYNVAQPAVADLVFAPKLDAVRASGATVVSSANPGCLMQIGGGLLRAGMPIVARHPVELLDAAYADESDTR